MCGIVGFTGRQSGLLDSMATEVQCRGPDSDGSYVDDRVSLGHTRLAVVDLSSAGHQPMTSEDGRYVISYNGEVYNHRDLRSDLEAAGYRFRSETDTETVLHAYAEWGADCVERFNGMFAFVVYDREEGTLFLARDHVGIKPLYYYRDDGAFVFASTIPPILQHDVETAPNRAMIRDFLLYGMTDHTRETLFENVHRFPSGHHATYDLETGDLSFERWWEFEFTGDFEGSYEEATARLASLARESVERRLMSDVPVGTCLSGGIDSSAIACLIDDIGDAEEFATFSAVFPDFEYDESEYIETVCAATGLENHAVEPTGGELAEHIVSFTRTVGEPMATPSPFAQNRVFARAKAEGVTVLLDGQGADELFAGYHPFYGNYLMGLLKRGQFRTAGSEAAGLLREGNGKLALLSFGMQAAPMAVVERYFERRSTVGTDLHDDPAARTAFMPEFASLDSLHDALTFYVDNRLEHLLVYEDRNSMAASREARVPFLDPEFMEFVSSLPEEYLISGGTTKTILRDALDGIVPPRILERRDKIAYATPERRWLDDADVKQLVYEWLCFERPRSAEFLDVERTRRFVEEHYGGGEDHSTALWKTLFLEAWVRAFWAERDDAGRGREWTLRPSEGAEADAADRLVWTALRGP